MADKTVYLGYGSNLWLNQMKRRCPESKYIGFASLSDWRWIINDRGYANIISSPGDIVYGLVFQLTAKDESSLDNYEGSTYEKLYFPVDLVAKGDVSNRRSVKSLIYVDMERKTESEPVKEYIYRMNMGIIDALKEGIPADYIEKYLRPFIPELDD
ncbi:hypothetical protein BYT27DRAFT_7163404 [Phlegmacium glaucopus]|nr:hypothetical protein BYT27DRAFT_7163404 [Phlegmacium glaucopus]